MNIFTGSLYSQNKTIKGRVITEYLETLPYTLIFINDTVQVGRTDLNGFFQIEISTSVQKLLFTSVGFEQISINSIDKCDEVELVMMLSSTYDFMTFKQIDKYRMRDFKKLPKLHKQAFEKGIFRTDKACYRQEFKPYYKKNRSKFSRHY